MIKKVMTRQASNKFLQKAKNHKNDEFYTILSDVEKELKHYKKHLKNKTIFCNCDDPRVSNFFHYFSYNFEKLKIKKLITTCYKNQDYDLFSKHELDKAIYLEYNGDKNNNNKPDLNEIGIKNLNGDGDFRSQECISLLENSDIIITNPPFSLFREYVSQLIRFKKKFLIVGNWNAITYKEIFKLIQNNELWLGVNSNRNFSGFTIPDHYPLSGTEARVDNEGNRIVSTNNTCWFTNLDIAKRHEELILYKKFKKEDYPEYDNYHSVEVSKVKDIPMNYKGVMGVPITFLDKYNPDQFEIIGSDHDVKKGLLPKIIKSKWTGKIDRAYLNGKRLYARLLIKNKN